MEHLRERWETGALLASLIVRRRPMEAFDHVITKRDRRRDRSEPIGDQITPISLAALLAELGLLFAADLASLVDEHACREAEAHVRERMTELGPQLPFSPLYNGDIALAQLCYAVCRVRRPSHVIETGVGYGVTSAFILAALEVNGQGVLHSIDLPPLARNVDGFVGAVVPNHLQDRWQLHRGMSRRVLPRLLASIGQLDLFIHDSLHTYSNMRWEFQVVQPYLSKPSVVIADDVNGNPAFTEWAAGTKTRYWGICRSITKEGFVGVAVL